MSGKKRRKGKGGKPRLQGIERQPNGQPSRKRSVRAHLDAMTEKEAKSVVIEARHRHTGLPEELLDLGSGDGKPNAGTVHGLMCLRSELTDDQWEDAEHFIGLRTAWLRAIDAPGRPIEPVDDKGVSDPVRYAEWCALTRERWANMLACLQEASTAQRSPIIAAFDVILVRQQYLPHLVGDLRIGLNAIHRQFRADRQRAA